MEKEQFLDLLRSELIAHGFTQELAAQSVQSISLTFEPDDIKAIEQITDPAEAATIAQAIARDMAEKHDPAAQSSESGAPSADSAEASAAATEAKTESEESEAGTDAPAAEESAEPPHEKPLPSLDDLLEDDLKDYKPPVSPAARRSPAAKTVPTPPPAADPKAEPAPPTPEPSALSFDEDEDDDIKVYTGGKAVPDPEGFAPEPHKAPPPVSDSFEADDEDNPPVQAPSKAAAASLGRTVFWTVFFCTLPITAVLFAAYYVLFAAGFAALCALIVGLFAALIGGVAVGTTVSLVGIIYGIVQLFTESSPAPGLYELGLGLTIAGSVMLAGILIYNCAIRFIPWVIRKLGVFFRFSGKKLKQLFKKAKEACYKL